MASVQFISAAWCKRCQVVRPEVMTLCQAVGLSFEYVDYDEIEDEGLKASVASLPTIRMLKDDIWTSWNANTLEDWKAMILVQPIATVDDF